MAAMVLTLWPLMPAHAGIQFFLSLILGPRFRGDERSMGCW
jgi:hypothetical protein